MRAQAANFLHSHRMIINHHLPLVCMCHPHLCTERQTTGVSEGNSCPDSHKYEQSVTGLNGNSQGGGSRDKESYSPSVKHRITPHSVAACIHTTPTIKLLCIFFWLTVNPCCEIFNRLLLWWPRLTLARSQQRSSHTTSCVNFPHEFKKKKKKKQNKNNTRIKTIKPCREYSLHVPGFPSEPAAKTHTHTHTIHLISCRKRSWGRGRRKKKPNRLLQPQSCFREQIQRSSNRRKRRYVLLRTRDTETEEQTTQNTGRNQSVVALGCKYKVCRIPMVSAKRGPVSWRHREGGREGGGEREREREISTDLFASSRPVK